MAAAAVDTRAAEPPDGFWYSVKRTAWSASGDGGRPAMVNPAYELVRS